MTLVMCRGSIIWGRAVLYSVNTSQQTIVALKDGLLAVVATLKNLVGCPELEKILYVGPRGLDTLEDKLCK